MLTHIQASHTDALKTHSLQTFLPQDWEVKGGQQFFGTSISRKKIDIRVVPALRGDSLDRKVPFQYCSNFTEAVSWNEYKDASIRHASYACRYFCVFVVAKALTEHKLFGSTTEGIKKLPIFGTNQRLTIPRKIGIL